MLRRGGVHGHARGQRDLHGFEIRLRALAVHAPGQRRVCTEGLLIDEVAPAANALPDQKAQRHQIKQRQQRHLAPFGGQGAEHKRTDDRAIDGDAALADVDHLPEALILKGCHSYVINTGTDDGHDRADGHNVHQTVRVDAVVHGIAEGVEHRQQHARRGPAPHG